MDEKWCESVESRLGKINEELSDVIEKLGELKGRCDILVWIFGATALLIIVNIALTLIK